MLRKSRAPGFAIAGLAAISLFALSVMAAGQSPSYVRFQVSDKVTVYAQFQNNEMRMATSVEGLPNAKPVKARPSAQGQPTQFAETDLPVPAEMLPAGCTGIKTILYLYSIQGRAGGLYVTGTLNVSQKDANNSIWTYLMRIGAQTAADAVKAPVIGIPAMDSATFEVVGKPSPQTNAIGVGVKVKVGNSLLAGIMKDGANAEIQVRVVDKGGKEVSSAKLSLDKLGFS